MARRRNAAWLRVGVDAWVLGLEAASVIGLRTLKITKGGPAADAEIRRMVAEKVDAAMALQMKTMTGGLGVDAAGAAAKALAHYRRKVRANRRRLSKS
jgi:hypothetical protein